MAEEIQVGCQRPAVHDSQAEAPGADDAGIQEAVKESRNSMIKVGKQAPEFSLPAYVDGKFGKVSLSDYKGQWVSLCFYPGDFTFV